MNYKNTLLTVSMIFFTACMNTSPKPNSEVHAQLYDGKAIGYAYMEDGKTLVSVSKDYKEPKEDTEVIVISRNGFYPNYDLSEEELNGASIKCSMASWQNEQKGMQKKCDSEYTTHSTGQVFANTGLIALGVIIGSKEISDMQSFNKEYFLKVVEENNLIKEQQKLLKKTI